MSSLPAKYGSTDVYERLMLVLIVVAPCLSGQGTPSNGCSYWGYLTAYETPVTQDATWDGMSSNDYDYGQVLAQAGPAGFFFALSNSASGLGLAPAVSVTAEGDMPLTMGPSGEPFMMGSHGDRDGKYRHQAALFDTLSVDAAGNGFADVGPFTRTEVGSDTADDVQEWMGRRHRGHIYLDVWLATNDVGCGDSSAFAARVNPTMVAQVLKHLSTNSSAEWHYEAEVVVAFDQLPQANSGLRIEGEKTAQGATATSSFSTALTIGPDGPGGEIGASAAWAPAHPVNVPNNWTYEGPQRTQLAVIEELSATLYCMVQTQCKVTVDDEDFDCYGTLFLAIYDAGPRASVSWLGTPTNSETQLPSFTGPVTSRPPRDASADEAFSWLKSNQDRLIEKDRTNFWDFQKDQ